MIPSFFFRDRIILACGSTSTCVSWFVVILRCFYFIYSLGICHIRFLFSSLRSCAQRYILQGLMEVVCLLMGAIKRTTTRVVLLHNHHQQSLSIQKRMSAILSLFSLLFALRRFQLGCGGPSRSNLARALSIPRCHQLSASREVGWSIQSFVQLLSLQTSFWTQGKGTAGFSLVTIQLAFEPGNRSFLQMTIIRNDPLTR